MNEGKKPIRVCMVLHAYYLRDTRVRRYADALVAKGAEVDVLCLREEGEPTEAIASGVTIHRISLQSKRGSRLRYVAEYATAFLLFGIKLNLLNLRHRYDIVHVHNMPDFLVFTALIPRILGTKLILDIHDPTPEFYMSKYGGGANNMLVFLLRAQERFACALAHAVITANSNFQANLVKRHIPAGKISVVNNMPDTKVFDRAKWKTKRARENECFVMIYPGTIAPRYGLSVVIRALPLLIPRIPRIRLRILVARQVAYVDELAGLAKQLGVFEFVSFEPAVPLDKMPAHLVEADIGIYPGLSDPHMNIATPTKVLEYAAMGLPVIASRLPILESLFTDRAIMYFDPGNVQQFAQCVVHLHDNPACRDELVRNADEQFACRYSWANEQHVYLNVIDRLLGTKPPGRIWGEHDEKRGRRVK